MSSQYKQRLERALAETTDAGLSPASTFPPLLRSLSRMGLPVRPLHFMSTPGLVIFLFLGLAAIFLAFHWLAVSLDVNAWAFNKLRQLGQTGIVAIAAVLALLTAIVIRAQAISRDLPRWGDL
jgi:hypothetical protein